MATITKPMRPRCDLPAGRLAEHDTVVGASVDMTQFRAGLHGFAQSQSWGRWPAADPVRPARVRLSPRAGHDLLSLFGQPALPPILAALDQLSHSDCEQAGPPWRQLRVCGHHIVYRPLVTNRADSGYLVVAVAPHRTVEPAGGTHRRGPGSGPGPDRRPPEGLGRRPGPTPLTGP